jgi:hypothetical protein
VKLYTSDIVERARKERQNGSSLRTIEKLLNIPNTTISRWVRDIHSDQIIYQRARQKERTLKQIGADVVALEKMSRRNVKLLLALLYWCEGSKYPSSGHIAFTNSDFNLIKTFLELLRRSFPIQEDKIKARLQIHSTHDYKEVCLFWSKLLHIPPSQFHRPTITEPTRKMKRQGYLGTCTIKYYDVQLLLQIIGIYEAFFRIHIGEVAELVHSERLLIS